MTALHDSPALVHWSPLWTEGEDRPHCGADRDEVCIATRAHVTCPACRGEADDHRARMEAADRARLDAAPLHDSHAIGDDGPPPDTDLLLSAVQAVTDHMHGRASDQAAALAVAAYAKSAGIPVDHVLDRILASDAKTRRSPVYVGSRHDARVTHVHLMDPQPGERFRSDAGWMLTAVRSGRHGRLRFRSRRDVLLTPRQATTRGALHRIDGA